MFAELTQDFSLLSFLAITLVMILGSSLQASAGFGSGLVAVPLLGLIDERFIPAPILFAYIFLCSFMYIREREAVDYASQKFLLSGLMIGSILAFISLAYISVDMFPLIAALFVLASVGFSLIQKEIKLKPLTLTIAGSVSGLMNTLAGLSGPPMALVMQFQQPAFIRANLAFAFIFASFFSIAILFSKNLFVMNDIWLGFFLVPGMFLGFFLGGFSTRFITKTMSRRLILTLSCVSSIALIFKSL